MQIDVSETDGAVLTANTAPHDYVYIVDDDKAAGNYLAILLTSAGFRTKRFSSGQQFLHEAPSLEPGCLVSDVRMPEMDGITLLKQLKASNLRFPVVLITGLGDIKMAVQAITSGAVDFIEKSSDDETILATVRRAQQEMNNDYEGVELAKSVAKRLNSLTARERDVLERLLAGQPNKAMARELAISPRTVESHRSHVMAKMQAGSVSQLVRLALLAGLKIGP
jgi:two-component system response regulator FixJ